MRSLVARWTASRGVRIAAFVSIVTIAALLVFPPRWLPWWRGLPLWLTWGDSFRPASDDRAMTWEQWAVAKQTIRSTLAWDCSLAFALNLPRMYVGLREVWRASFAKAVR